MYLFIRMYLYLYLHLYLYMYLTDARHQSKADCEADIYPC